MRVGAVIVGRLDSARLPGKLLRQVAGRALLDYVAERLERVRGLDAVVLATSDERGDDPLAAWADARGLPVHRGPRADVLGRVLDAARAHRLDAAARVNGDSPWLDPDLLSAAVARMRAERPDFVTNLAPRCWPYGVAAEVAATAALERAHAHAGAADREHVTRALYRDPGAFATAAMPAPADAAPDVRLVVDTEQDLRRFEALLDRVGPHAPTALVVEAARALDRR